MHCRSRGDFNQKHLHIETRLNKGLAQPVQRIRAVRKRRLLDDVMKKLLDKTALRLFVPQRELGYVAGSGQMHGLAVVSHVVADAVNGPVVIAGAEASDRVVL